MFSTFTGSSRRPRNVNLSGQTGNPFANTSWSPSVASNATQAVSNAQAEREKRQAERQRVKAAGKIQRTWRGHRARRDVREAHRTEFDHMYQSASRSNAELRVHQALSLLVSFFSPRRSDDIRRLVHFSRDVETVDLLQIVSTDSRHLIFKRLSQILVNALDVGASERELCPDVQLFLKLLNRTIAAEPRTVLPSIDEYYGVLAKLCQIEAAEDWANLLFEALCAPLTVRPEERRVIHRAYAFSFLTRPNLRLFENNIKIFSKAVSSQDLSSAITDGYAKDVVAQKSKDALLWLLAHSVDLGQTTLNSPHEFNYLESLCVQLSTLSPEISIRLGDKTVDETTDHDDSADVAPLQPLCPYVSSRLVSLVESTGISKLLNGFPGNLATSSRQESQGTSLLAGYILALLRCFPSSGDDIRMSLFLEQIPTSSGPIPTLKYLWQIMKRTSIFWKLQTESEKPVDILRRYLQTNTTTGNDTAEEQDWRIILLFLELYVFVLRLSDDEDFFGGIRPSILESNSSTSRIRSCSLSLEDVKLLTIFLKNTAFTLHYNARALSSSQEDLDAATRSRVGSYFGSQQSTSSAQKVDVAASTTTRLDLETLRGIVTMAMKMLYERDSRNQFLPRDHWLMSDKLDDEDFIKAVINEEEHQSRQDPDGSDSETDPQRESYDPETGFYFAGVDRRVSRRARLQRLRSQQLRAQKERRLAEMGPKLEILKHMPFVVPFETRVRIFREFTNNDRARRNPNVSGLGAFVVSHLLRHHARIRREDLFEDAFKNFYGLGEGLKDPIAITFVDQFGAAEAGIDGGGVTKEFLNRITSEAFGAKGIGLFKCNEKGLLYPDPTAIDTFHESLRQKGFIEKDPEWNKVMTNVLQRYEFLGMIVGKCMYENILVDLTFAGFFLLKWTSTGPNNENGYKGSVNDLRDLDEDLYKGMLQLKHYPDDVSDLGFDFTISDQISRPAEPIRTVTRKLIPNGDQIPVTNDNRLLYISYVARHRLVVQPWVHTSAFLRGLRAIIKPSWLSMFNQMELQRLVGGDSTEIDIEDLRRNTVYSGLYEIGDDGEEHPTIRLFWKVMADFTDAQRREVLKYVSSTPRAPLLGFSALKPKFSIRDGGTDEERLPSTSTCVNLLKLPRYTTEATLKEKLLYAVQSGAGFDLS